MNQKYLQNKKLFLFNFVSIKVRMELISKVFEVVNLTKNTNNQNSQNRK